MTTNQLLEKIGELFTIQTAQLRKEIKESAENVTSELRSEFKKAIIESQEDTIQTLTEVINEDHGMLDKRLTKVEKHLGFSSTQ